MSSPSTGCFDLSTAHLKPGTVAIVTGAAEGLGKSFAEGLLRKGAKGVCLSDVNEPMGRQTLRELTNEFGEDRAMFVRCDVTSPSDVDAVFAKTKEKFGAVNLMVNNAGLVNEKVPEICIAVNITGVIRGTFTAIDHMSRDEGGQGGKIVNIASIAGVMPISHIPVYSGTKHAVVGFTKSLVADTRFAEQGISFGILCPSFADTRILTKGGLRKKADRELAAELKSNVGILEVSAVRDAFLQLVLDESWSGKVMIVQKEDGITSGL